MPFTSEKQRRFMFAEHPRIAKRWAHEDPEGDEGLPTYAHGRTTSPDVKAKWERLKRFRKGKDKEAAMKCNSRGVLTPGGGTPYAKKKVASLSDLIKKAQASGPRNVRAATSAGMSCMTCKYFTPLAGSRRGPGMCNVGTRPQPVNGTDVSDDYESKKG